MPLCTTRRSTYAYVWCHLRVVAYDFFFVNIRVRSGFNFRIIITSWPCQKLSKRRSKIVSRTTGRYAATSFDQLLVCPRSLFVGVAYVEHTVIYVLCVPKEIFLIFTLKGEGRWSLMRGSTVYRNMHVEVNFHL